MSIQLVLITIFIAFFMWSFKNILKHSDLAGIIYATLFLYIIFTMIGYAFVPQVPISIRMYYGPDIWYKYYMFMTSSMILTYAVYKKINSPRKKFSRLNIRIKPVAKTHNLCRNFYQVAVLLLCVFCIALYLIFPDKFVYGVESKDSFDLLIGYVLSLLGLAGLISWMLFRTKQHKHISHKINLILALISICIFLYLKMITGNRSVLLSLVIGFTCFELMPLYFAFKHKLMKIITVTIIILLSIWFLFGLTYARYLYASPTSQEIYNSTLDLLQFFDSSIGTELIFRQDYFFPSLLLFEVIDKHLINPLEVIISNVTNALILMKYPQLTATIAMENMGLVDRQVGFAFHLFIEGFYALGWLGIIYNALVCNLGIRVWQWFATSDNAFYNRAMTAILSTQVINVVRDQNSAFIKALWFQVGPAMAILLLGIGWKLQISKSKPKV